MYSKRVKVDSIPLSEQLHNEFKQHCGLHVFRLTSMRPKTIVDHVLDVFLNRVLAKTGLVSVVHVLIKPT